MVSSTTPTLALTIQRPPMPDFEIRIGDAIAVLRAMPDASVDCCITSPPYWGLRDYVQGRTGAIHDQRPI